MFRAKSYWLPGLEKTTTTTKTKTTTKVYAYHEESKNDKK